MTKDEILARVEGREFEKRCVDVNICRKCGGNLSFEDDGGQTIKTCVPCNLSFPYV